MRLGTIAVREVLPEASSGVTDEEIHESLWHYYYDVEKSVAYLASKHAPKKVVKKENVKKGTVQGGLIYFSAAGGGAGVVREGKQGASVRGGLPFVYLLDRRNFTDALDTGFRHSTVDPGCSKPFSVKDFFKDMPWLHTPLDRQATFIAPLYPRGGLLGGSSDGAPKMSKLQALAAARKKKAQEQKSSGSTGAETPMAKLTLDSSKPTDSRAGPASRGFPIRKRKDSNPHEKAPTPIERESSKDANRDIPMETPPLDQAEPSAFANTMFSTPAKPFQQSDGVFTLPYNATPIANNDPFAGPSPDDVVMAAQSKGSTISASSRPKK
jgi:elongation factor 1 alpha-like protein